MPERKKKGTPSKPHQAAQNAAHHGKPPHASSPHSTGPNTAASALASQDVALNPPFDPRMRRMGSPLNLSASVKRGWIQDETGTKRVNFLFNPAAIDIASQQTGDVKSPLQASQSADVMDEFYASTGSSTSVSLLYDRTYELFSQPANATPDTLASAFGAYADIAAWYTFFGMLESMPTSWSGAAFTQPMMRIPAYLFIGPNLYFYGFAASITTTVTHWTQNMIPQRAKVDLAFTILPRPIGSNALKLTDRDGGSSGSILPSWLTGLFGDDGDSGGLPPGMQAGIPGVTN